MKKRVFQQVGCLPRSGSLYCEAVNKTLDGLMSRFRLNKLLLTGVSEVGAIAFALVLSSWYWQIDEHAVFILILFLSAALFFGRRLSLTLQSGSGIALVLYLLLLMWVLISTLWSATFALSLSYASLVFLIGIAAVLLGATFGLERVMLGLWLGVVVISLHGLLRAFGAGGSWRNYFVNPENGPGIEGSAWGLFTNPISLAVLLGLAIFALIFGLGGQPASWVAAFIFGIPFLFGITTIGILASQVALVGAIAVGIATWHARRSQGNWKTLLSWGYPAVALLAGIVFWLLREPILRPLGEAPDFSGRTILWDWYFEAFLWNPVIGAGWGSAPTGWPLSKDNFAPVKEYFMAHNGFIDLGIMLGGVGVLLLVGTLVTLFITGAKRGTSRDHSARWIFIPVLITYLTLNDLFSSLYPRFLGFFLIGIMVGVLLRDSTKEGTPHAVESNPQV